MPSDIGSIMPLGTPVPGLVRVFHPFVRIRPVDKLHLNKVDMSSCLRIGHDADGRAARPD